jgi:hypothetical protein
MITRQQTQDFITLLDRMTAVDVGFTISSTVAGDATKIVEDALRDVLTQWAQNNGFITTEPGTD